MFALRLLCMTAGVVATDHLHGESREANSPGMLKTGSSSTRASPDRNEFRFSEGVGLIERAGRFGYIDSNGTPRIPARWLNAGAFSEGRARILVSGKWGYIDPNGDVTIPPEFGAARNFHQGLAAVEANGSWGFISKEGKWVISPR
jgi:hypothetical protein